MRIGPVALAALVLALSCPGAAAVSATETVFYDFPGVSFVPGVGGAVGPDASPLQASDGNFYGTSFQGGANNTRPGHSGGEGTVWKVTSAGAGSVLYSFGASATDARFPQASLVESGGVLYGTTSFGGIHNSEQPYYPGTGAIFKIALDGTGYAVLHSFEVPDAAFGSSALPSPLTVGLDGALYGTTAFGGASNKGTVFRITTAGTFTTLHSFAGAPLDGALAYGLTLGDDGNFYGLSGQGGAFNGGTFYRVTPAGELTVLHAFGECRSLPRQPSAIVKGGDGNFYGTSWGGGGRSEGGTFFVVTPAGVLSVLHRFPRLANGGSMDPGGLALGPDGNVYGVSHAGGANTGGTFFMMTPLGIHTELHAFGAEGDADGPYRPPLFATDGAFYGTTMSGGSNDTGALYRVALSGLTDAIYPTAITASACPAASDSGALRPTDLVALLAAALAAFLLPRTRSAA